jgi:TPR repeat protein
MARREKWAEEEQWDLTGDLDTVAGMKRLADAGNAGAALVLGWAHFEGRGTRRDANEGAKGVRRSAELGNAAAHCILGSLLYQGSYVPVNKQGGSSGRSFPRDKDSSPRAFFWSRSPSANA